jgi:hypothetical protein
VERRFFPLDEELELLPGSLTPHLQECLVRLGAWIPSFEEAGKLLRAFTGADVSEPLVRRKTEGAGAAYVALAESRANAPVHSRALLYQRLAVGRRRKCHAPAVCWPVGGADRQDHRDSYLFSPAL